MWSLLQLLYKYTCFFVLFMAHSLQGQDNLTEWDAYEPDSIYAVRNAIKYDPVQIIVGDYSLYYERIISSGWSLEASIGFTRRNYAVAWRDYSLDNLARNIEIKTGYAYGISVRRYLKPSEELRGMYAAFMYGERKYNTIYAVVDTAGELTGDEFPETRLYRTLSLALGFQALTLNNNFFVDFYFGPAFRFRNFSLVVADDVYDPESFRIIDEKSTQWGIIGGLKFGFGF